MPVQLRRREEIPQPVWICGDDSGIPWFLTIFHLPPFAIASLRKRLRGLLAKEAGSRTAQANEETENRKHDTGNKNVPDSYIAPKHFKAQVALLDTLPDKVYPAMRILTGTAT